jgi:hypothetical protein
VSTRRGKCAGRAAIITGQSAQQNCGHQETQHAERIHKHPKSFVSLDGASHMLARLEEAESAAVMLAPLVQPLPAHEHAARTCARHRTTAWDRTVRNQSPAPHGQFIVAGPTFHR